MVEGSEGPAPPAESDLLEAGGVASSLGTKMGEFPKFLGDTASNAVDMVKLRRQRRFQKLLSMHSFRETWKYITYVVFFTVFLIVSFYIYYDPKHNQDSQWHVGIILSTIWFVLGIAYEYRLILTGGWRYFVWCGVISLVSVTFHIITGAVLLVQMTLLLPGGADWTPRLAAITVLSGGVYIHAMTITCKNMAVASSAYRKPLGNEDISHEVLVDTVIAASRSLKISCKSDKELELRLVKAIGEQRAIACDQDWSDLVYDLARPVDIFRSFPLMRCLSASLDTGYKRIDARQYRQLVLQAQLTLDERERKAEESGGYRERSLPYSTTELLACMHRWYARTPWMYAGLWFISAVKAVWAPLGAYYTGQFVTYVTTGDTTKAYTALAIIVLNRAISPTLDWISIYFGSKLASRSADTARKEILLSSLNAGTLFTDETDDRSVAAVMGTQVKVAGSALMNGSQVVIVSVLGIVVGVLMTLEKAPLIGAFFLSFMAILYNFDTAVTRAVEASVILTKKEGAVAEYAGSTLESGPVIRATGVAAWAYDRVQKYLNENAEAHFVSLMRSSEVDLCYGLMTSCYFMGTVIPLGVLTIQGDLTPGDFIALMMITRGMIDPLMNLARFLRDGTGLSGALQAVENLIARANELSAEKETENGGGESGDGRVSLEPLEEGVHVECVSYSYEGTDSASQRAPLSGVSLTVPKGNLVALCGSSGSGKSTLMSLVMRSRKPTQGCILWDGVDLADSSLTSFRKHVGVVFQKPMILRGTIAENITFGCETSEDEQGQQEAMWKAAELAEIGDIIRFLPDEFNTVVGRGIGILSHGEQQRLCLARALYRKPSLLLLDEVASALDLVSEAAIFDTLLALRQKEKMTIISVTHRLSTTKHADDIVVLTQGRVAEFGTYSELVEKDDGVFRSFLIAGGQEKALLS